MSQNINSQLGFQPKTPQRSLIRLSGSSGSTVNVKTRTWTTVVEQFGNDIQYRKSSVLGDTFTIAADGCYMIVYSDGFSGADRSFGIIKNSQDRSIDPRNTPLKNLLIVNIAPTADRAITISACVWLRAGDELFCQTNISELAGAPETTMFMLVKVSA